MARDVAEDPVNFEETINSITRLVAAVFIPMLPVALVYGALDFLLLDFLMDQAPDLADPRHVAPEVWAAIASSTLLGTWVIVVALVRAHNRHYYGANNLMSEVGLGLSRLPAMVVFLLIYILLVGLGSAALILPGLFMAVLFLPGITMVALGQAGVIEAFGQSARLVWKQWWFSLGTVVLTVAAAGVGIALVGVLLGIFLHEEQPRLSLALLSLAAAAIWVPLTASLLHTLPRALAARKAPPPPDNGNSDDGLFD